MNNHLTKEKGDTAVALVVTDLTLKGYYVFFPVITEHLPFDLIAYKDNKSFRIQVKYSKNGNLSNRNSWISNSKRINRYYTEESFDYYAVYLPDVDKIIYPSIKFGGSKVATKIRNSATRFYWYEDFLDFTDLAEKKSYKDFGIEITKSSCGSREKYRKVERPSKEELFKLIWEKPTTQIAKQFGVSDKAIEKWCKSYQIEKPPRGYWNKKSNS